MLLAASETTAFDHALLVIGVALVAGALLAALAHRSFLSLTALFVVTGFVLGEGGIGFLDIDPRSGFVAGLATLALVVILFRDGLEVDGEMLQREWHLPLRKIVLAMPITCVIVAAITHQVTNFGWTESFLLGALLSPTDPVLSSTVVTNPRVPRVIRNSLNLESGLNDGLALPAVLAFAAAASISEGDFVWWKFVLQDVGIGFATGLVVGFAAGYIVPKGDHQKGLFGLGVAFAAYGLAHAPPHGNGLIATFVAAIVLGVRRPDMRHAFEDREADVVEIVKLVVFLVFGALFTAGELFEDGSGAVAIVLTTLFVARPVAIFASLIGTRLDRQEKAFMAWFGPKGVATMTFALLILSYDIPQVERLTDIAALTVFVSILAHGLSDHPGAEWMARHSERKQARVPG